MTNFFISINFTYFIETSEFISYLKSIKRENENDAENSINSKFKKNEEKFSGKKEEKVFWKRKIFPRRLLIEFFHSKKSKVKNHLSFLNFAQWSFFISIFIDCYFPLNKILINYTFIQTSQSNHSWSFNDHLEASMAHFKLKNYFF